MVTKLEIVVVDDKILITDLFESFIQLSELDINLNTFNDPYQALEYIKNGNEIDILITDYKMPGINGIELLDASKSSTTRVLISGYVSSVAVEKLAELNAIFFEKPVPMKEVGRLFNEKLLEKNNSN